MNLNDDIIIAGIGMVPVGEHWDLSLRKMGARAVRAAIADSGSMAPQALFAGNAFASILTHQTNLAALIADEAGLTGAEASTLEAAGASGGAAVRAAYVLGAAAAEIEITGRFSRVAGIRQAQDKVRILIVLIFRP